jgi:hypothetical protein
MSEPSWARKGIDLLLAYRPDWDVARIEDGHHVLRIPPAFLDEVGRRFAEHRVRDIASPWVIADLVTGEGVLVEFAVWRETGAVYRMDGPAVREDPFLVPEGSPYGDGPVEQG